MVNCTPEWYQVNTYTFHFQFSEETSSHKHAQRDGEDEDKGQCERYWTWFDDPQNGEAHDLDGGEQVHTPRAHLQPARTNTQSHSAEMTKYTDNFEP